MTRRDRAPDVDMVADDLPDQRLLHNQSSARSSWGERPAEHQSLIPWKVSNRKHSPKEVVSS